jgi:hypothetical protein
VGDFVDYYTVLGIPRSATRQEITRVYRELAKRYHPDANPDTEVRFKDITAAYDVLQDPDKKKRYDEDFEQRLAGTASGTPRYGRYEADKTVSKPLPEPDVIDFGLVEQGKESEPFSVAVKALNAWPRGVVVDLDPKSGKFWRLDGMRRVDPNEIVRYDFVADVPSDLTPGHHKDSAVISFGDETARIRFRVDVGSAPRIARSGSTRPDPTSVPPLSLTSSASVRDGSFGAFISTHPWLVLLATGMLVASFTVGRSVGSLVWLLGIVAAIGSRSAARRKPTESGLSLLGSELLAGFGMFAKLVAALGLLIGSISNGGRAKRRRSRR